MRKKLNLVHLLLILFFLFSSFTPANAATLFPSPNSGTYNIGNSFSVGVYVSSADQALNAVSGTLSFHNDQLEVTSLSKAGSIVSLWVQEPSFSNSVGTVSFEGIVLNPGFTGSSGKILTVNFKTKNGGAAPVTFSSGAILANDGLATNILSGLGSARYNIEVPVSGPAAPAGETPSPITGTPAAPNVTSQTHQNSDQWYNNNTPQFNWDVPTGVSAVRLLVGSKAQADPTVVYDPAINSRVLDKLDDGIWYFHVQLRSAAGWGGVTHFRFQVDTQNPEYFNISEIARQDLTDPVAKFLFESVDLTSGIDHFEIQIDDQESISWVDDESGIYHTPVLEPGKHRLMAKAVDLAGNSVANFSEFEIKALDQPEIISYSQDLTTSERFRASGNTYPNSQVVFELQKSGEEAVILTADSDAEGKFDFVSEESLAEGKYTMRAKAVDARGAQSEWTDSVEVKVQKPAFWRIGSFAISVLSVVIPLIALVVMLILMLWFTWYKFRLLRQRVGKEVGEAEVALRQAFVSLKKNVATRIKLLEKTGAKRKLTKEEEKVIAQLRKDLDQAESVVAKEIKDIRQEIK